MVAVRAELAENVLSRVAEKIVFNLDKMDKTQKRQSLQDVSCSMFTTTAIAKNSSFVLLSREKRIQTLLRAPADKTTGDWLILRSLRSKMCLSPLSRAPYSLLADS